MMLLMHACRYCCISLTTVTEISQLPADHLSISRVETTVTYRSPVAADAHFHAALSGISSAHQPQLSVCACAVAVDSHAEAVVTGGTSGTVGTVKQLCLRPSTVHVEHVQAMIPTSTVAGSEP